MYMFLKKNLCLGSKFEDVNIINRNSDSLRNWKHSNSPLQQNVNLWHMNVL